MNKNIWHEGTERPLIWEDPLTGRKINTYALCLVWYDGWIEDLCKVTDDGKFESMTSHDVREHDFFEYWAYTYDLIPNDLR